MAITLSCHRARLCSGLKRLKEVNPPTPGSGAAGKEQTRLHPLKFSLLFLRWLL
jgi:hypothetical protein